MKIDLHLMAKAAGAAITAKEKQASVDPRTVTRFALPAIYGAGYGAEEVPENRLLGAAGGGVGASLGAAAGSAIGHRVAPDARLFGYIPLGALVGGVAGLLAGRHLGVAAARRVIPKEKSAGIADRPYMHEPRASSSNVNLVRALRYGLPGVYGALGGAELVPQNKFVGAVGGAAGAIGGSELGAHIGEQLGAPTGLYGEAIGSLLGRIIGASVGQNLGARTARLAVADDGSA